MKTKIMYATECAITVYFNSDNEFASADWREHYRTLSEAIFFAESILDTQGDAERIVIWDAHTGEILAECENSPDDEDDYGIGYDHHIGCFTWDE